MMKRVGEHLAKALLEPIHNTLCRLQWRSKPQGGTLICIVVGQLKFVCLISSTHGRPRVESAPRPSRDEWPKTLTDTVASTAYERMCSCCKLSVHGFPREHTSMW